MLSSSRAPLALTGLAAVLLLGGCQEAEPERVWKPEDHGKPPETQVDPSRVPGGSAGRRQQVDPDRARGRAAAALWRVSCARCHGPEGRGNGPEAPAGAEMADMTDPAWQRDRSDAQLAQSIRQGQGEMHAFGDEVNPAGIEALVGLIRSFAAEPEAAGSEEPEAAESGQPQ